MDQNAATLDVAKELDAEAFAFVSSLDQTGHIGEDELVIAVLQGDDAKVRDDGRERVIRGRDICFGHDVEKGALSDAWETDETGIGEELQFQDDAFADSRVPIFRDSRHADSRGFESRVPASSAPSFGHANHVAFVFQVGDQGFPVFFEDKRPARDLGDDIGRIAAKPEAFIAFFPVVCLKHARMAICQERVYVLFRDEEHGASAAAVSPVWPAFRDVLLAMKGDGAVPAVAGTDFDNRAINEHRAPPEELSLARSKDSSFCSF